MLSCIKSPVLPLLRHPLMAVRLVSTTSDFVTDKAFIDGRWVSCSRGTFEVRSPEDDRVIGSAANCSEKEADLAIHAASKAFESWSATPAKVRSTLLRKMFELQMQHQPALADLISRYELRPFSR